MTEIWQSLSLLQQVLVIIAVPSSLILVLQLILLLCGLGDADGSFEGLDGDGVNDFSVADIGGLNSTVFCNFPCTNLLPAWLSLFLCILPFLILL